MKNYSFWAIALMLAVALTSCTSDNRKFYFSYGTVVPRDQAIEDNALRIRRDAGSFLIVRGWTSNLRTNDRIIAVFEPVGNLDREGDNVVRLRRISWILTKDPVLESAIADDETENTRLGNDGFVAIDPWFGGLYLNVNFRMLFARNSMRSHLLNIVADDVEFDGNTITLTLRHNAFGRVPGSGFALQARNGIVSFNLVNLFDGLGITNPDDYPNIVLKWEQFTNVSRNETETMTRELGKFVPWTVERDPGESDTERTELDIE